METVGGVLSIVVTAGDELEQPPRSKTSAPSAADRHTFRLHNLIPSPPLITTLDYRRNASKHLDAVRREWVLLLAFSLICEAAASLREKVGGYVSFVRFGIAICRRKMRGQNGAFPAVVLWLNFNVFGFLLRSEGSESILYSVTEDIKPMSKPSDLVQGTLDMLLLKILALEPMNGFAVSQRLKQVSGDVLQMSDGSLYPALHKLEQEGWISAEWKTSEKGRRAKYYSLTRLGRRQLEKEADNWGRLSTAISRVIKLKEA